MEGKAGGEERSGGKMIKIGNIIEVETTDEGKKEGRSEREDDGEKKGKRRRLLKLQ